MLTQEQINDFHRNGYLIMKGIFKGKELQMLQEAVDKVQEQGIARNGSDHKYYKNADGSEVYWRSENMWQRDPIFQAVTVHQELLENIGQVIGHHFYPWNDSLVVKQARSGAPVHWHQDPPYSSPQRMNSTSPSKAKTFEIPNFTTDIYLDESNPENGCVWAIHGRHLVGHVDLSQVSEDELFSSCGATPIIMEPGDVLFHCLSTPHGSTFNDSDTQRRIFYIHYLNEEVYKDGYSELAWSKVKKGWGHERYEFIQNMIKVREQMGFDKLELGKTLQFGENGFQFSGRPVTPHHYWKSLQEKYSQQELEALKVMRTQ